MLLKLFGEMVADEHGLAVSIGRENASFGLGETSVRRERLRRARAATPALGVLGPTRMDYSDEHRRGPGRRPLPLPTARRRLRAAADAARRPASAAIATGQALCG